jgi:hypothetical protein
MVSYQKIIIKHHPPPKVSCATLCPILANILVMHDREQPIEVPSTSQGGGYGVPFRGRGGTKQGHGFPMSLS